MARILRLYVIREIALPTGLALLTITFLLLIGIVYEFINLLLQPMISVWSVAEMLMMLLPGYITMALPMAILIGTLIGVGRMTLDREVLAMRASGINLFRIFAPALVLALLLSGVIMWASGNVMPVLQGKGLSMAAQLQFELIQALEPGRFHDKIGVGTDSDMVLYFRDREPEPSRAMQGVVLKLDEDVNIPPSHLAAAETTRTLAATPVTSPTLAGAKELAKGRDKMLTMIFAERGQIQTRISDLAAGGHQSAAVVLTLNNGTIHRLVPDPAERDSIVIRFDKLEKRLFTKADVRKPYRTMTNSELSAEVNKKMAETRKRNEEALRDGKKPKGFKVPERSELVERYALSLAFFVFALMAIPLAIWVKPSGKSWGILLAIGLMLFYYVLLRIGGTMVEVNQPMGVMVAFLPNLMFTLLGAGLWWHNLRS